MIFPVMAGLDHLKIMKADTTADKQIVWGVVYAPGVPDTQGDSMTAEEIEKMAYDFAKKGDNKAVDVQHDNKLYGCHVVESFIVRKGDPDFPIEGAWAVAVHVDDPELWAMIKSGDLNGFSMQVLAVRKDAELNITAPGFAKGSTYKTADHEHTFEVFYDDVGKLIGGRTSMYTDEAGNSHFHVIKRGTATEKTEGHAHRFAFIDKIVGVSGG